MALSSAFWISPTGTITTTDPANHINLVVKDPEKFGLSKAYIDSVYQSHGEPVGFEGNAREDVIEKLVDGGWIRIRKYPRGGYIGVTLNHMSPAKRSNLKAWAHRMLTTGINGDKELDKEAEVRIVDLSTEDKSVTTTISDIAHGQLDESWKTMLETIYGL